MPEEIKNLIKERNITRLCHFTSSQNFIHVQRSGSLRDQNSLRQEANPVFNPTDELRLDGHLDKLCCSIENPNAYYLDKARAKNRIFKDWIVIFLKTDLLCKGGTIFCKRNAAANGGALLRPGVAGFSELFCENVEGAGGRMFNRNQRQLPSTPTDIQAEALVLGPVPFSEILGIAVQSEEQGFTELARWESLQLPAWNLPIYVAPTLFDKNALTRHIHSGIRPSEIQLIA